MADIRIKVAKDKAKLVKALRAGEGSIGLFKSYVEVLIFAASIGVKSNNLLPFEEFSSKDPDPIPWEHFVSKNYTQIIDLLAVVYAKNPKVLENSEECEKDRIKIFEGYANGGLSLIQESLHGTDNLLSQIQLLLAKEKKLVYQENDLLDLEFLSN